MGDLLTDFFRSANGIALPAPVRFLDFDVRLGIVPAALFQKKLDRTIDKDRAILGTRNLQALKRARGRAFEVLPAAIEARSMARTLEPVFLANQPHTEILHPFGRHCAREIFFCKTGAEERRRLEEHAWEHEPQ